MEATFSKELTGLRRMTHVIYYPLWFKDKGYNTGDLYFEGKNAFRELKKYCLLHGYKTITIQQSKRQKIYNF